MPRVTAEIAEKTLSPLTDKSRLLTMAQLCDWWGVSRKYIWELSTKRKGAQRLPSYKLGKRRLFIYDECYFFLKNREA